MKYSKLYKLSQEFEQAVETLRTGLTPFSSNKPSSNIEILDSDGISDEQYKRMDPTRKQVIQNLKDFQELISLTIKKLADGEPRENFPTMLIFMKKFLLRTEDSMKRMLK